MVQNHVILFCLCILKYISSFSIKKTIAFGIVCHLYIRVNEKTQNTPIQTNKGIILPFRLCKGYKVDHKSSIFRNPLLRVDEKGKRWKSYTHPPRNLVWAHMEGLEEGKCRESQEREGIAEDSTGLPRDSGVELDQEAVPGDVTEEDVWKMKAAISQNSTLGLDWVKTIETLQNSAYCKVSPLTIAYNSAMSASEKNCNADLCLEILSDMKKRGKNVADVVSYKYAIMACVKSNRPQDALRLQEEALEEGMTIDHGTIRSILWLLADNGYGVKAVKLLEMLKKMSELCKTERAVTQTDYMYTIQSCINSNMMEEAKDLYEEMRRNVEFKLESKSLRTLLELAYNISDHKMAMDLYSSAVKEKSFELTLSHLKLLVNTLLLNGKLDLVDKVWSHVSTENLTMDPVLCQLVLQSYSVSGNFEKAYEIIKFMDKESLINSNEQYILAIKSCQKCGEWKLAIKIMRMAQQKLEQDDIEVYNSVLEVCNVAREWETMSSLYQEITRKNEGREHEKGQNLKPNGDTIAYMLICYYHLDEEEKIKELMSMPVLESPLLSKIKKSLNQENY